MLNVRGLNAYYGQSHVLHDLSLEVQAGETLAIMGRNGMGKTTLLKTLIGVLPSKSGHIQFGSQELAGTKSYQRVAAGLAYVPQGRMIFPQLTVEENILTGMENSSISKIPEWVFKEFPVLWEMRARRGGNLSGGQQQQLAIGRALVMRPRLLILDEPTEGIQPSIIKDIGRVIETLRARGTMAIVLVEQYYVWARALAQTMAIMDRGAIAMMGAPDALDEAEVQRRLSV